MSRFVQHSGLGKDSAALEILLPVIVPPDKWTRYGLKQSFFLASCPDLACGHIFAAIFNPQGVI